MKMRDYGKIGADSDFIYTTNSPHRDEQATLRVVAMNGIDRFGHNGLFIFATNTDIKPEEIRNVSGKDGDFIQDDKHVPTQDYIIFN